MREFRIQNSEFKKAITLGSLFAFSILSSGQTFADTAASAYNAPLAGDFAWETTNELFARPVGSFAYLDNNSSSSNDLPWWQTNVAHPIANYDASLLPSGGVRLDTVLEADVVFHRLLKGWNKTASPTNIDNVYTYTPGSQEQEDQTARAGQNAYFNLAAHPIPSVSADIGTEIIGNYNMRYWFPVNDEHRMYNDDNKAKIVRGEVKFDNGPVMLRAFEGVPRYGAWLGQNDLFYLLPTQDDPEYYRRISGSLAPRGGEARFKTPIGTLDVIGGTEPRWTYGSSLYARYDLPVMRNLEQSFVYRNENIPFGLQDPDERRWTVSYNASYPFSDRVVGHAGVLYQPFRVDQPYVDVSGDNAISQKTTKQSDAFGFLARTEVHPMKAVDMAGVGYTYLGPTAGNKHQIDLDASRTAWTDWTFSGAYIYRQPIRGPVPLMYEGTAANSGALISQPRGPDDPFRVQWDNRKAHIIGMTVVFDPTPGTPFFKSQRNLMEDWNMNPDEDATWTAAVQYRLTHYLTNTDRLYYFDEYRNIIFDPTFHTGALATEHPFSTASGLLRWRRDQWHITADLSGGEALAGSAIAYTPATNFYKPSTVYMSGGLTADNGFLKMFFRYGQDIWGPYDTHVQAGWSYHKMYQAGISLIFLRDAEVGLRYTGTRMTNEFIGSDMAAFNEYTCFLSYHFTLERDFSSKFQGMGRPLPQTFPEVHVSLSSPEFTPDGSGPDRNISVYPKAYAEAGILSWKLHIRNDKGEIVRKWEGNGVPPKALSWEGVGLDGKPLPVGTYKLSLDVVDLYGNETTSTPETATIRSLKPVEPPPLPAAKAYTIETILDGLRVTLSSLILFDVNKYDLKGSAKEGLDQVVELLHAYPLNVLRVSGHTDSTGSQELNQAISEKRAQAVIDYLVQKGNVSPSRIQRVGYGEDRPVASNATEEGRQKNRRVEIDILK